MCAETLNRNASDTTTCGIRIKVEPRFERDKSTVGTNVPAGGVPVQERWVFAYRVEIINEGEEPARLQARRWVIRDADGEEHVVEGPGVVGYQPRLLSGESFEYESWCPLETSWGTMEGSFKMERLDDNGKVVSVFQAQIARFYLVGEQV